MRVNILAILILSYQIIMAQSTITKQDVINFKKAIEGAGYFQYVVNKSEIKTWEKMQIESLTQYGWLRFPEHSWIVKEEYGKYPKGDDKLFDFRTIMIDIDYLFRGGMESYLKKAKQIFEIRGLNFQVKDEKMEWGEKTNNYHYFKHEVYINGKKIIIADGNLNEMDAYMYFKKYKEIIENELKAQKSNEIIKFLTCEDYIVMIIGDKNLLKIYEKEITSFENKLINE
jgi:hypothetical protein